MGETSIMLDLSPQERKELRTRKINAARQLIALAAVAAIVFLLPIRGNLHGTLSRTAEDWLLLPLGLYVAYLVALDVRSGVSRIGTYAMGDKYAYMRSADPIGYWFMIVLHGAVAAGMVIGSLGDLLGFWRR